jgi:hypothetical protein
MTDEDSRAHASLYSVLLDLFAMAVKFPRFLGPPLDGQNHLVSSLREVGSIILSPINKDRVSSNAKVLSRTNKRRLS